VPSAEHMAGLGERAVAHRPDAVRRANTIEATREPHRRFGGEREASGRLRCQPRGSRRDRRRRRRPPGATLPQLMRPRASGPGAPRPRRRHRRDHERGSDGPRTLAAGGSQPHATAAPASNQGHRQTDAPEPHALDRHAAARCLHPDHWDHFVSRALEHRRRRRSAVVSRGCRASTEAGRPRRLRPRCRGRSARCRRRDPSVPPRSARIT
jgi:hypothetical protein